MNIAIQHSRRSPCRPAALAALGLLATCAATASCDDAARENAVKAAFLYNFTQFVEWPAGAFADDRAPLIVGVLNDDIFTVVLEKALQGKTLGVRQIVVRRLAADRSTACHLLYVSPSADNAVAGILAATHGKPVLTVGETDAFGDHGGGMRFFAENRRMRFELNMKQVTLNGLKVSAKLQKLARPRPE